MHDDPKNNSFFYPMNIRLVDNIVLYHQIFENKLGPVSVVGHNTPNFGGGQHHNFGLFGFKKIGYSLLVSQIELA
jgi:hypothetical protein